MVIGDRLKTLREAKNFSQGDIEKKLACCVVMFRKSKSGMKRGQKVASITAANASE